MANREMLRAQDKWVWTVGLLGLLGVVSAAMCTATYTRRMWQDDVVRQVREVIATRAEYKDKLRVLGEKYQAAKLSLATEQRRLDQAVAATNAHHESLACGLQAEIKMLREQLAAKDEAVAEGLAEVAAMREQLAARDEALAQGMVEVQAMREQLAAREEALAKGAVEAERATQTIEAQTEHITELEVVAASIRRHYETQVDGKQQLIRSLQGKITRKDNVLRDSLAEANELLARTSPHRITPVNTPLGGRGAAIGQAHATTPLDARNASM